MQIVKVYSFGEMKNRFYIFIALIITMLVLNSCSKKQENLVLSRDFEGEIWGRFDYLEANFDVVKAPMTADLVMEIYVTDVYPNIYPYEHDGSFVIAMTITSPDGGTRSRDYKFRLKNANGDFKSEKVDGCYKFELPLINGMSFNEKGGYAFKVENKYNKEPLYGIKRLSINCLQNN